jgi:hypothetical protein
MVQQQGKVWYVDANVGGSGSGKSLQSAFSTMEEAFANVGCGDTIYLRGKIREQLVTPVQIFDVSVLGLGNRPRHADSTPAGGELATNSWLAPASPTAATATVRVLQQGWRFENILFGAADANSACVELVRNAASGDDERDASHAILRGCRFQGTGIGIKSGDPSFSENVFNALVEDCWFNNMTHAMKSANSQPNFWTIRNNHFGPNTNQIIMALQASHIIGNVIGAFTAAGNSGGIDLNGGVAGNIVSLNVLSGTYSNAGGYRAAGAGDEWGGNFNSLAGGVTASDPA